MARVMSASVGWKAARAGFRLAPGHGLSERPLKDGRLHYTPSVLRESSYEPTLNSGSEVDVPLVIDGNVIGVLAVESTEPEAFSESDFEILTAAANQASIAIARARLNDENALAVCAALEGRGALDAPIHQRGSPGRATIHPPTTGGP